MGRIASRFGLGSLLILGGILGIGCSKAEPPQALTSTGSGEYVEESEDPKFPRIRFADAKTSLNDRCPVRKSKLNRKMPPIYANGRPVGFC